MLSANVMVQWLRQQWLPLRPAIQLRDRRRLPKKLRLQTMDLPPGQYWQTRGSMWRTAARVTVGPGRGAVLNCKTLELKSKRK